ncbi:hypothetical protein [Rhizobium sp. RAF56]|uniref:hypothetical protein n=1 Tax=Rhizobium sp. RAF56 TaxID=3233062 RepID=UPI003F94B557
MAVDPIVVTIAEDIVSGKLPPNTPPAAVQSSYPDILANEDAAIANMIHACRLAANKAGAVFVLSLNGSAEIVGQFDHSDDLDDNKLVEETYKVARAYRQSLKSTDPEFGAHPAST